jgi:hypothetical protein
VGDDGDVTDVLHVVFSHRGAKEHGEQRAKVKVGKSNT